MQQYTLKRADKIQDQNFNEFGLPPSARMSVYNRLSQGVSTSLVTVGSSLILIMLIVPVAFPVIYFMGSRKLKYIFGAMKRNLGIKFPQIWLTFQCLGVSDELLDLQMSTDSGSREVCDSNSVNCTGLFFQQFTLLGFRGEAKI